MEQRTKIGFLVGGGLKENFRVRLVVSPQEIQQVNTLLRDNYPALMSVLGAVGGII